jgi:hypothetical protein
MDDAQFPFESDEELILELVSLPHWRAYKRLVSRIEDSKKQRLYQPSTVFPDDFYRKEQTTSELRAFQIIVQEVENQAKRRLTKKRKD